MAPIAEEKCCAADWADMKRARWAGRGTREASVCMGTLRTLPDSMNRVNTNSTGIQAVGQMKPATSAEQ